MYNDKLEFRQIVLGHIKRILEISSHELRNSSREVFAPNVTHVIEQEDTRYSYIQSIENLAYVLTPYFDEKMTKVYEECIKIITSFNFEIIKILKKEFAELCKELGQEELGHPFVIAMKLKYAKKLFYNLNLLLKRIDYLKSAVYGEDTNDEIIEEEKDE